ncbi:hypothetical protein R6Q59_018775 [Mikania micrantha]|uniref:Pentatricopeptide repeat-containing protein n=1 Tax=Mikania micrantha TaxID=192012 RepID=A0A5N6LZR8_9ASTR|nr:hypothetical protein E3N88_35009 [Mikania micrantha]
MVLSISHSHPIQFHHHPYVKILNLCMDKRAYHQARMVHEHLNANGFYSNLHIKMKLVILYCKAGDMKSAREVFDEMRERSVVSWTALLFGYARNGYAEEAAKMFLGMRRAGVNANQFTYASTLSVCTSLMALRYGLQIQGCIHKSWFVDHSFVQCALIELHSKCGKMENACNIFGMMLIEDLVSWNSMIGALAIRGSSNDAIVMFRLMFGDGMTPDRFTLASVLMAYARSKNLSTVM